MTADTAAVATARTLKTTKGIRHSYGRYSSVYDLYVGNIDRSKPVGVLFYFDADSTKTSNFRYKDAALMGRIRDSAAKRNLVLIAPHTPGGPGKHRLHNWWDDREKGAYARNLADAAIIRHGLDYSQVWLTGWSGGAELITKELMAHRQSWFTGGGVIVMGGGEAEHGVVTPSASVRKMPMRWYVGDRDHYGATIPRDWSARVAAQRGVATYRRAGFTNAKIVTVANQGHFYNVSAIIERGLAENYRAPAPKPKPKPKPLPPPVYPVAGDVVSIDGEGNLWNYNGHKSALGNRTRIGWGWGGFTTHHQTDWDADGIMDILAVHENGNLVVYRGQTGGGYEGQRVIGADFDGYKVFPLKTCTSGTCRPHLAAIAPGGELYRWKNTTNWLLTDRTRIGWGWADMTVVPVDWDSDGDDDIAGIDGAGNLWLYSTENGNFEPGREKIGAGWGHFKTIMSVPGLMGGNAIVAKTPNGELVSYPYERGYFPSNKREVIGRGWTYHRVAGSVIPE